PGIYEITAVWESPETNLFQVTLPAEYLKVGHTYRARGRFTDVTGRSSNWSAPMEVTAGEADNFAALQQYIRPAELMYNPPAGSALEYIELLNTSSNLTVQLSGAVFTDGIDFTFPAGAELAPGEYGLVVQADPTNNFAGFRGFYNFGPGVKIF